MNRLKLTSIVLIVASIIVCGCDPKCKNISERETILLLDVSDPDLHKNIRKDLESNFQTFIRRSGLWKVSTCEKVTFRIAPIGSQNALKFSSARIGITETGLSYEEVDKQAEPTPLVNLLSRKMEKYIKLSQSDDVTSGSNIANILLKAINASNIDAKNSTIIVFSDLIENTPYVNMYRRIPSESELDNITSKLFEPIVLNKFEERREAGLSPNLIVVSKPTYNATVDLREVRNFWRIIFEEKLGLEKVQFVDNLTQYE